MSRKRGRAAVHPAPEPIYSRFDRFTLRILGLPRFARLLVALLPAVAIGFVVQPIIDEIYLRYFFSPETNQLTAWVIWACTLIMYLFGWVYIVGMVGSTPTLSRTTRRYVAASIVVVVLAVVWVVYLSVRAVIELNTPV